MAEAEAAGGVRQRVHAPVSLLVVAPGEVEAALAGARLAAVLAGGARHDGGEAGEVLYVGIQLLVMRKSLMRLVQSKKAHLGNGVHEDVLAVHQLVHLLLYLAGSLVGISLD